MMKLLNSVLFTLAVVTGVSTSLSAVYAQSVRFAVVGDFGNGSTAEGDVARLIDSKNVSFVATVGDNVYAAADNGSPWQAIDDKIGKYYHQYMHPYPGIYGAGSADGRNNFFPVLGNHDYGHGGAKDIPLLDCVDGGGLRSCSDTQGAWYDFFNLPGNERYYSERRGEVEIFAFSDYYRDPDWDYDFDQNGVVQGIKDALQASTATWKIVLLHFAPYTSGNGGTTIRRFDYKAWGADAVIAGHYHHYERLSVDGFPYFVNGAGGTSHNTPGNVSPYSEKIVGDDYGAMIINADARSIKYDYYTRDGSLRDTFTQTKESSNPPEGTYRWQSVPIGGGGYITGIDIHPQNPNLVYARTDVGGSYRWNATDDAWIPLNDDIPFDLRGMYGIESLALDRNNQNVVYAAIGSRPDICKCDIIKSTDRGQTWTASNINSVRMAGNSLGRWSGERLAVDPNNGQVIYFGSRFDGLWRSESASSPGSWSRIASGTFASSSPAGSRDRGALSFVAIDPISAGGGRSQTVYIGDFDRGVYRSTNAGGSFAFLAGSPGQVEQGVVAPNGDLYVTHTAGVSRFDGSRWSSVTPQGGARAFSGVDVSPTEAGVVVVAERSEAALGNNKVYRSTNNGVSWTEANRNNISLDLGETWGTAANWSSATADVAVDPGNSNRIWLSGWFGVWRTNNFSAQPSVWKPIVAGHEELVTHALISPSRGAPLISGVADHGGFRHADPLNLAPDMRLGDIEWRAGRQRIQDTEGLDFAAADPDVVVRVGGRYWGPTGDGEYSRDNGRTWSVFNRPTAGVQGGLVAITAQANNVVWIPQNTVPWVSNNMGAQWAAANFSPALSGALIKSRWTPKELLASDRVEDGTMYLLDYPARRFYRSTNGGFDWQQTFVFSGDLSFSNSDWEYQTVKALPGVAREVWLNSHNSGLYRSTNGGNSFSKISGVTSALSFSFGAPRPGSDRPTLFLYGKVDGFGSAYSIFRSDDLGQTWTEIRGEPTIGNGPKTMAADSQVYGRVYIGTGGRGVYVGYLGDNDPQPNPEFSVENVTVDEAVGIAKVTVSLSSAAKSEVRVSYATTPGSADRRLDFYGTFGNLLFSAGQTEQQFEVQILDDSTPESTETINTRLFGSSGPEIVRSNGTISITDND